MFPVPRGAPPLIDDRARAAGLEALERCGGVLDGPRLPLHPVRHGLHAVRSALAFVVPPLAGWAWASRCLAQLPASCGEAPGPCALCEFPLATGLPVGVTLAFVAVMAWVEEGMEAAPPPLGARARAEAVEAVLKGESAADVARRFHVLPAALEAWTATWLESAQHQARMAQANAERGA